ncbi:hypothetical protein [Qipengyuania sp. DGS5-3]|uniref:hypothetical protein n=1 Tax=Qipengyuania sp. DGS5-3 TaxID=3349632 RepID=UPI0036D327A9
MSESFYFPTKAQKFRAWGRHGSQHFWGLDRRAHLDLVGRYAFDKSNLVANWVFPDKNAPSVRVLLAPSFNRCEVLQLASALSAVGKPVTLDGGWQVGLKLHPATKRPEALWRKIKVILPGIKRETGHMEDLAHSYDALATKNSTSAIDFLLLGKPVGFADIPKEAAFPSRDYGFAIDELPSFFSAPYNADVAALLAGKNEGRLRFLNEALNV